MKTILRKLTAAWPLVICLLLPALMRAETAVQAWVQRYNGSGSSTDYAYAIAVDSSGNVVVTGESFRGSGSDYDYVTIKYSSAGVPLWTNLYTEPGSDNDHGYAVAVDGSNNVIVARCSYGGTYYDYAIFKYSSAGVPLWTNRYNGAGNGWDLVRGVAVDSSNDVVVTGYSDGSGSSYDYATIKYSSGGVPLWTNRYNGPGNAWDKAQAVAVDGSNNVIVTGESDSLGGSSTMYQYATIKYSSGGMPLWTNRYNEPAKDHNIAFAIAVDSSNRVAVTGYSYSSTNSSVSDYATVEYSSAGMPLWTNRYNGLGNGFDVATAVAVDASNNVIVTGSSGSGTTYGYATIKYSSAGVPLWTNRYNGPEGRDEAWAMAVDRSCNVIVTGRSIGSHSYFDYATIKYSSTGVPLWTNRYSGPGTQYDGATAVAVDGSGNVIATG